jgi:hypothetical protein
MEVTNLNEQLTKLSTSTDEYQKYVETLKDKVQGKDKNYTEEELTQWLNAETELEKQKERIIATHNKVSIIINEVKKIQGNGGKRKTRRNRKSKKSKTKKRK